MREVASAEDAVHRGRVAERPFVLLVQPTIADPSRAPAGKHVAWAYCHVPNGWTGDATAAIEAQVERHAPGFRDLVLARSVRGAGAMEAYDANYVGGDINGGVQDVRQLLFRPVVRWNPYTTPDPGLFLCSSSTPPGGGVHGMSGVLRRTRGRAMAGAAVGRPRPQGRSASPGAIGVGPPRRHPVRREPVHRRAGRDRPARRVLEHRPRPRRPSPAPAHRLASRADRRRTGHGQRDRQRFHAGDRRRDDDVIRIVHRLGKRDRLGIRVRLPGSPGVRVSEWLAAEQPDAAGRDRLVGHVDRVRDADRRRTGRQHHPVGERIRHRRPEPVRDHARIRGLVRDPGPGLAVHVPVRPRRDEPPCPVRPIPSVERP